MARIMSASRLTEPPLGLCLFPMIYSGTSSEFPTVKGDPDCGKGLATQSREEDMCLSSKQSNRKAEKLLYFQACMNPDNVSMLCMSFHFILDLLQS